MGKTTISALIINRLIYHKKIPVLAIDADPNTCLDTALGISAENTIGRIREETRELAGKGMTTGIAKQQMLEMKIAECLIEMENFDFLAMGRPEGAGCYCYANNVLGSAIMNMSGNYPYIVVDNEAGLENLSRRIIQNIDLLIIASDASYQGFKTIKRLYDMAQEMKIQFKNLAIISNKKETGNAENIGHDDPVFKDNYFTGMPYDKTIIELSEKGESLLSLTEDNILVNRIDTMLQELVLNSNK